MPDPLQHRSEPVVRREPGVLDPDCHADTRRFHGGIGSLDLLRALRGSRQKRRPLSLNVQFPARSCTPTDARHAAEAYLRRLSREIEMIGCHLGAEQRVEQFHLGGATPHAAPLQQLMTHLRQRFHFLDHDCGDYGIDVDLHHTDWATMGLLREQGFNRVSIGGPDLADRQRTVACRENLALLHSLIDAARTFGFRSVNVDLGYGHAWQTAESFALKLDTLIELEPDRLQVFDCARPPARYRRPGPDGRREACGRDAREAMRRICFERLPGAGYQYIGLGQFVRPDDDLMMAQERGCLRRNCQGFTCHGYCDHVGLGLGAISQFDELYTQNTERLDHYLEQLDLGQLATCRGWRCEAATDCEAGAGPDD
ncbi:coproporphyrinogen III oxidase [Pseudomonas chlororaphis]|nr:coproporphyrinogen III oxidase [Pseudomonas chlororaphis]